MNAGMPLLYELVDRIAAIETEMQCGSWSFSLVSARHDAIRTLVDAAEDQISMAPKRQARFVTLPYLDLTEQPEVG
jgi:hypothetical protein